MEVENVTAREYIQKQLANSRIAAEIAVKYTTHAREMGGRICSDGYPDARFKCTYGRRWEGIRSLIGEHRQRHASMMHQMQVERVYCCKYNVVSRETALSNMDKIRKMFNWSK